MVYKFKNAARLGHLDAQMCGERLELIERTGDLTPAAVLSDAEDPASPLHEGFQWDDKKAAHEFRLTQAQYILRCIVLTPERKEDPPIRAFLNLEVGPDDEPATIYMSAGAALSNPETRRQILQKAYNELLAWSDRYRALSEFAPIHAAVAAVDSAVFTETDIAAAV